MIYRINSDYYVKVGSKYIKLSMQVDKKGELIMTPTKDKIESNKNLVVKTIDLSKEKERIIRSLKAKSYSNEE